MPTTMTKFCCVKGCLSGRYEDRKRSKENNEKSKTIFKVPKDKELLHKWEENLQMKLKPTDAVCELHFADDSVKRFDKIHLVDGSVFISQLLRYELVNGAVPLPISAAIDHPEQSAKTNATINEEKPSPSITNSETTNQSGSYSRELDVEMKQEIEEFSPDLLEFSEDQIKEEEPADSSDKEMPSPKRFKPSLPTSTTSSFLEKSTAPSNEFIFEQIRKYFQTSSLPQAWTWVDNKSEICFILVCSIHYFVKLRLIVKKDLSMKILVGNHQEIDFEAVIKEGRDVYNCLNKLKHQPICTGALEGARFSEDCSGLLMEDECYKRQQIFPRCRYCREFRRKLLHEARRKSSTIENKYHDLKTKSKSLQRKYNRLLSKAGLK